MLGVQGHLWHGCARHTVSDQFQKKRSQAWRKRMLQQPAQISREERKRHAGGGRTPGQSCGQAGQPAPVNATHTEPSHSSVVLKVFEATGRCSKKRAAKHRLQAPWVRPSSVVRHHHRQSVVRQLVALFSAGACRGCWHGACPSYPS